MLVRSVAAACIKLRKRDKICDMPFFLISGFFLSNSDTKNFHKEAERAYLHKICRFTHNGSFTARPCSQ